jgi:hypothetical protein
MFPSRFKKRIEVCNDYFEIEHFTGHSNLNYLNMAKQLLLFEKVKDVSSSL